MSERLQKFDDFLARVPFMSGWSPIARIFSVAVVFMAIVVPPIVIAMQPALSERLTSGMGTWCIDELKINGADTVPVTYGISMQWKDEGNCLGNISFRDGEVTFPGLQSYSGKAYYSCNDDVVKIINASSTAKIFEGKYDVETNGSVLTMKSDHVYIRAHLIRLNLPF